MQHDAMVTSLKSLKLFGMAQAVAELAFTTNQKMCLAKLKATNS